MQKVYDKKLEKMLDGIKLVMTYAKPLIEKDKVHTSASKDVYWVIFDKDYKPYFLVLDNDDKFKEEFSHAVYTINKKATTLSAFNRIAALDMQVFKKNSILDYLEIEKRKYLGKKIGSHLIDLFDYLAFTKGAKKATGIASAFHQYYIDQTSLNELYKRKGFTVRKRKGFDSSYTISKTFDYDKIKEYAKQFITIKQDNVIFKFNIPDYYKPMVQDVLKSNAQKEITLKQNSTENLVIE